MTQKQKGFTLIEVVTVIAIIGILASILTVSIQKYRVRARDAQRISDLNKIAGALELYYADHHVFPPSSCGYDCNGYSFSYNASDWDALAAALAPYTATLPNDPLAGNCSPLTDGCYAYAYGNVGQTTYAPRYDLIGQLETPNHTNSCAAKHYTFYFDHRQLCGANSIQSFQGASN